MRTFKPWTDDETQTLRYLIKEHGPRFTAIGRIMNRTPQSVEHRWRWINLTPEQRKEINEGRRYRERQSFKRPHSDIRIKRSMIDAPDEVLDERDRRLSTPRTLTSEFFGDPPPGYSALDRKRQGVVQ